MANPEHVEIIRAGEEAVDEWYKKQPPYTGLDLHKADLRKVNLSNMNLARANLSYANLRGANLFRANLLTAFLQEANLRFAILEEVGAARADFIGALLDHSNLKNAYLSTAVFDHASLIEADLRGANIYEARFTYTDLRRAKLDGIVVSELGPEGWSIEGVSCSHFFIEKHFVNFGDPSFGETEKRRIPPRGYLAPGEFEDRFIARPTIEFVFTDGMPALGPAVLDLAILGANAEHPEAGLRLLDITARGGMPRAIIEVAAKISKEDALALVSACYEQKLQQMENEIRSLRDDKQSLLQVAARRELLPAISATPKFMSGNDLSEYYGIDNREALRSRLYRFREKHKLDAEAFQELTNKGVRQPQFLYNVAMVDPLVRSLKKREASPKRPSRRN